MMKVFKDGEMRDATDEEIAQEMAQRQLDAAEAEARRPAPTIHLAWLRAALAEAGLLDAVNAAVATAGPVKLQMWEYATTITRNDADVVAIANALSIDLDAVFARAIEIRDTRVA